MTYRALKATGLGKRRTFVNNAMALVTQRKLVLDGLKAATHTIPTSHKVTMPVAESYILFCLLCYRLSVYTDSAVFYSKLCIILIRFMDY